MQTTITLASGTPETPIYGGASTPGTGVTSAIRPNLTGVPLYSGQAAGLHLNQAAYSVPSGQWGDARRDSITGPNQFSLGASMSRTFRLHARYTLDTRLDATNVLNHVTYSGWNTTWTPITQQFGAAQGPNGMRSMQLTMHLRF